MNPAEIERNIRARYADYFADFQRDAASARRYFAVPVFRVAQGQVMILRTSDEVGGWLRNLAEKLARRDYRSSRVGKLDVTVLDPALAHLRAQGTRHDRAGVAFEQFDVIYTFVRPDPAGEWAITGLTSVASP